MNESKKWCWELPKWFLKAVTFLFVAVWLAIYVALKTADQETALSWLLPVLSFPYMWLISVGWPAKTGSHEVERGESRFHIAFFFSLLIVLTSLVGFALIAFLLPRIEVDGSALMTGSLRALTILLTLLVLGLTGKAWAVAQGWFGRKLEKLPEILTVVVVAYAAQKLSAAGVFIFNKELAERFEFFCACMEGAAVGYAFLAHFIEITYPPKREAFATAGNYRSDISSFLDELKKKHVDLEERQKKGRGLLWDREPIDLDERRANASSKVPFLRDSSL